MSKPIVGVSSCLLGHAVRYDGDHKYDSKIADSLAQAFELQAFCPEVNSGMSIPRPPIQLRQTERGIRCVRVDYHNIDVTDQLQQSFLPELQWMSGLHGFILKANSPSCGIERVKVFDGDEYQRTGTGLFAQFIRQCLPGLPLVKESQLEDRALREQFIQDVQRYKSVASFAVETNSS